MMISLLFPILLFVFPYTFFPPSIQHNIYTCLQDETSDFKSIQCVQILQAELEIKTLF